MANIILPPAWQGKHKDITPEEIFWRRRDVIKQLGLGGLGALALLNGCNAAENSSVLANAAAETEDPTGGSASKATGESIARYTSDIETQAKEISPMAELPLPFKPNTKYQVPERELTPYQLASRYNN